MIYEKELSDTVIELAKKVYAELGNGYLEKVYEKALMYEFGKVKIHAEQQFALAVTYDGSIIGEYYADIVVEKKIIIELKAIKVISTKHHAQLISYLKTTGIKVGYIINFGYFNCLQYKRIVF